MKENCLFVCLSRVKKYRNLLFAKKRFWGFLDTESTNQRRIPLDWGRTELGAEGGRWRLIRGQKDIETDFRQKWFFEVSNAGNSIFVKSDSLTFPDGASTNQSWTPSDSGERGATIHNRSKKHPVARSMKTSFDSHNKLDMLITRLKTLSSLSTNHDLSYRHAPNHLNPARRFVSQCEERKSYSAR